jgi:hypothetical protein
MDLTPLLEIGELRKSQGRRACIRWTSRRLFQELLQGIERSALTSDDLAEESANRSHLLALERAICFRDGDENSS